jgi:hypothetical protein
MVIVIGEGISVYEFDDEIEADRRASSEAAINSQQLIEENDRRSNTNTLIEDDE